MTFDDLQFERTTVTSNGRYEVFVKVQDDDSTDYLDEPFEFATDDYGLAVEVRNLLIANDNETRARVRETLGFTEEQYESDGIWLQVFLTDTELDYEDEDEYWMSYDVI